MAIEAWDWRGLDEAGGEEPEGAVRQCGRRNFRVMADRPARLVGGAMRTVRYGALNGGAKGALIGTEK